VKRLGRRNLSCAPPAACQSMAEKRLMAVVCECCAGYRLGRGTEYACERPTPGDQKAGTGGRSALRPSPHPRRPPPVWWILISGRRRQRGPGGWSRRAVVSGRESANPAEPFGGEREVGQHKPAAIEGGVGTRGRSSPDLPTAQGTSTSVTTSERAVPLAA